MANNIRAGKYPLIYKYLKQYQEDPHSRVFAPLAEAYRKAGFLDEALEIAKEGMVRHPHFVGGKVALARCHFDHRNYGEVIETLEQVVQDVPDNIAAQRLTAESYLMLGKVAEALASYKVLLYFAPGDTETAHMVQELETQAYEDGVLILQHQPPQNVAEQFEVHQAGQAIESDPSIQLAAQKQDWMNKIQYLQDLLQSVERYRHSVRTGANP